MSLLTGIEHARRKIGNPTGETYQWQSGAYWQYDRDSFRSMPSMPKGGSFLMQLLRRMLRLLQM